MDTTLNSLHSWGQSTFGIIPKRIRDKQAGLRQINAQQDGPKMDQVRQIEKELDDLLEYEELWWNQRSRALWLQHGDKNTKFFHQKATHRRRKNRIDFLTYEKMNVPWIL
jgi:hypothetical protein